MADPHDGSVQAEILKRHPKGPVLMVSDLPDLSPAITVTVTDHLVLKALKAFPKGSSPGGFQLIGHNISWTQCLVLQLQCPMTACIN